MPKRRNSLDIQKEIYFFLKKNKNNEFSINQIFKKIKSQYSVVSKCLENLKSLDLITERKGNKKPIAERLFKFRM